ncbi:MAG: 5-oxoprolinase subunit PxpB [Bryobacterales bacterium]|nr:5-oxoprolinase subunit PxpB [Bryobacterales bacterium]
MRYRAASDRSLLVSFGPEIPEEISETNRLLVENLTRRLVAARPRGILNVHPAYASVLVVFDPLTLDHRGVQHLCESTGDVPASEPRTVEIPVHYGGERGPDLADVARHTRMTPEEVVRLHSGADYVVHFLGFSPGFPYLGGLPESIATPRLSSPRVRVPAGSVAIGGGQTGVYPADSPGGWRIIGWTPIRLFDPAADPPALLTMGSRVRFEPA